MRKRNAESGPSSRHPLPWNIPAAVGLSLAAALLLAISPLTKTWALLSIALLASLLPLALIFARLRKHGIPLHSLYEGTFRFSAAPLFIIDHKNQLICMNDACENMLGLRQSPETGQSIETLLPADWLAHLESHLSGSGELSQWDTEVSLIDGNAQTLTILLRSNRIAQPGIPPAILTACIDVSLPRAMAKRQTELVQRNRDFVQHLINVIPHPVYVRDAQSRYQMVNEAFAAIYERQPEQVVGLSPWDLLPDGSHAEHTTLEDQQVLEGKRVIKEVLRPYGLHNEQHCVVVSKGSCLNAEDEAVIVGAHFDVTRWRETEQALKEALEREVIRRESYQLYLQRLIDVIPHPVYVKDQHSRCVLGNEAFAHLQGCDRTALHGQLTTRHMDPQTAAAIHKEDAEVLAGHPLLKEELGCRFATDKENRYRLISKGASLDQDGEPVVVCALFDVTDWRLAEARWIEAKEEADRANEAKSLFLANMSHELRTPMHAILSFARLGHARTETNEATAKERGYFERIIKSGERLLNLLNDLLDLAKLEGGGTTNDHTRIDMESVIREALTEFAALIDSRQITLDFSRDGSPEAWGNAALMGHVIRNLLSNAIKFSPSDACLKIGLQPGLMHCAAKGQCIPALEIRITDQGVGIPEAELETIFDKFVQSSKTHSGAGGTGLGLAICREIINLHHGEIFALNRPEGGAEFVVRIPMEGHGQV